MLNCWKVYSAGLMLVAMLGSLAACGSSPSAIDSRCLADKWICVSHSDTGGTIQQVLGHNSSFAAMCPKAKQTCQEK